MNSTDSFPALEIDPRKVDRYERYLRRYARAQALDPLEHRRRFLHGLLFLARLRARPSRFVTAAPAASVLSLDSARRRVATWR